MVSEWSYLNMCDGKTVEPIFLNTSSQTVDHMNDKYPTSKHNVSVMSLNSLEMFFSIAVV